MFSHDMPFTSQIIHSLEISDRNVTAKWRLGHDSVLRSDAKVARVAAPVGALYCPRGPLTGLRRLLKMLIAVQ